MTTLRFEEIRFAYPRGLRGPANPAVFDGFSWQMPPGATVLLGPNGAGKTTLLSLAATALRPQAGSITLDGDDSVRAAGRFRRAVGWMPQSVKAIPGLTCREQVAYTGWLKGMDRTTAWDQAVDALARVDLVAEADRPTTQVSGGQLHRVGLAQLLVHRAELLLLDEPTAGLDPGQRARFRDLLREVAAEGPVLLSTHQVDDITELYATVVVLDHGQVPFTGTPAEFMALAPAGSAHPAEAAYASVVRGD